MTEKDTLRDVRSTDGREPRLPLSLSVPRGLWLYWILATTFGAAGGSAAFGALRQKNLDGTLILGSALLGLLVALAQSPVLGRVFRKSGRVLRLGFHWTLTSLIGWSAGAVASLVLFLVLYLFLAITINVDYTWGRRSGWYVFWALFILLGALAVSLLQQRFWQTSISPARRWLWISVVGWCAGWAAGLGVAYLLPGSDVVKGIAGGAIGGTVLGAITGGALTWLLAASPRGDGSSM